VARGGAASEMPWRRAARTAAAGLSPFYRGRMNSPDDRWRAAPEASDVVESAPREWPAARRRLGIIGSAAAALLLGLAAGYAVGIHHGPGRAAPARPRSAGPRPGPATPSAIPGGLALPGVVAVQQARQCSAQVGRELQLGVQVVNQSARGMVLRQVRPVLPLGGLQAVAQSWGPCGELPAAFPASTSALPAHGSAWLTVTFKVLRPCPAPIPVQFAVTFELRDQPGGGPRLLITSRLPGFADLGSVPYSGCLAG
jgi:hypothetical protein